jgi:hypothetical protein
LAAEGNAGGVFPVNAENFNVDALLAMRHSPIRNYVIPGLTSWLIGAPSEHGTVRLFECEREHEEAIIPHSHRFNFHCWVLRGSVRNRIWHQHHWKDDRCDTYRQTVVRYEGTAGSYKWLRSTASTGFWYYRESTHKAGECYGMNADDIHSIFFSRHALVLFFEGPMIQDHSVVLEPVVNGKAVPTFAVAPWMFERA